MKARAVSYGAAELKQMEHRYLVAGLAFSVAIHVCLIAAYIAKGVLTYDGPPLLPPTPGPPHVGPGLMEIFPDISNPVVPQLPHGSPKHAGGKYAIPVPAPIAPSNEDSILFKPGDVGLGDNPGDSGLPGDGGLGPGVGPGPVEEEPPKPFVPVEKEPVVIKSAEPLYPELALRAGLEGKVWVKIWVDREGRAHKAEVLKSTAEIFNEAALSAAMQFRFVPAYMSGGAVSVWVSIPFTFRLKS